MTRQAASGVSSGGERLLEDDLPSIYVDSLMTSFSTGLTAVLLLFSLGCAGRAQRDPLPLVAPRLNFVIVLSDDHRWDALGAAGNPAIITPVMDGMARDGVYFRQATVSVSQCHPVRASLLTGLPAHRHGVYSVQFQAPDVDKTLCQRPTVASLLRDAGY